MGLLKFILNRLLNNDDSDTLDDSDIDDDFDVDPDDDFDDDIADDDVNDNYGENWGMEELRPKLTTTPKFDEISFTGLIDNGLVNSKVYKSWLDGIEPNEVMPHDVQEIASHIADEFAQALPEVEMELFSGGFATSMGGNGTIFYDVADVMKNVKDGYGASNIVGSIAHEMGHQIVNRVFASSGVELTRLQHEIGADFMEGVAFGMTGIDPREKFVWLHSMGTGSADYLSPEGRVDVIERGIEWGERLRFIGSKAPELLIDFGSNNRLLKALKHVMSDYTSL